MSSEDELLDRDYPIQEDMRFQEKLWKLERAGWVALSLVVAITLLGVFGAGPLGQTHAQPPVAIWISATNASSETARPVSCRSKPRPVATARSGWRLMGRCWNASPSKAFTRNPSSPKRSAMACGCSFNPMRRAGRWPTSRCAPTAWARRKAWRG